MKIANALIVVALVSSVYAIPIVDETSDNLEPRSPIRIRSGDKKKYRSIDNEAILEPRSPIRIRSGDKRKYRRIDNEAILEPRSPIKLRSGVKKQSRSINKEEDNLIARSPLMLKKLMVKKKTANDNNLVARKAPKFRRDDNEENLEPRMLIPKRVKYKQNKRSDDNEANIEPRMLLPKRVKHKQNKRSDDNEYVIKENISIPEIDELLNNIEEKEIEKRGNPIRTWRRSPDDQDIDLEIMKDNEIRLMARAKTAMKKMLENDDDNSN
ncbi:hypothetical protein BCR32DRAFT_271840 [Anaeromyces robustus]|uniref:Uncharacterized protein n=1 Tax=Anaeromyces robustus TaxID=1754192 RepID=A0A1Y1WQ00_9FUNG|nr:hypothetical protein BCR32DRAFT_271840 [Anaeromyces robustus]|eukprot:ORX75562.1 hypothetical protein BCR32DRAFT_271840 [Anaeromyces robustus]